RRELMAGLESEEDSLLACLEPKPIGPARADKVAVSAPEAPSGSSGNVMLVGAITVDQIDGVITIRGDAGKNYVTIYGSSISSLVDQWGRMSTRITIDSAGASRTWYFNNYTGIDIDLGGGDDYLKIEGGLNSGLTIRGGDGNDEIVLLGNEQSDMAAG